MKTWTLAAVVLCSALAIPAGAASDYLVKDINPFSANADSNPHGFFELSGVSVFDAFDEQHGSALWRSDGTVSGTYLLLDPCDGLCVEDTRAVCWDKDWLLFSGHDEHGELLHWLTDGTRAGTRQFRLPENTWIFQCGALANGELLLVWSHGGHGKQLWRSNGTPEGTTLVREFTPGPDGTYFSGFTRLGNRTLFSVLDPAKGWVLWTTDGTAAGTLVVKDFPGKSDASTAVGVVGGQALLAVFPPNAALELWTSNGTATGTKRLAQLAAPGTSGMQAHRVLNGRFFAIVNEGPKASTQLWTSDGTAAGTRRLTAFRSPKPFGNYPSLPDATGVLGGRIFFSADDGTHGVEPWVSDGTPAGTHLLRDVCPGPCTSGEPWGIVAGASYFFGADDGTHGRELWSSDGTTAHTQLVRDICGGSCWSGVMLPYATLGKRLIFAAAIDNGHDMRLWASDGTRAGTVPISGPGVSFRDFELARTAHGWVFPARGSAGLELWRTNGMRGGTALLADLNTDDLGGSRALPFAAAGPRSLLYADDGVHGNALWASDGTDSGTTLIHEFAAGEGGADSSSLIDHAETGSLAFFLQENSSRVPTLWRSDGTAAGTFVLPAQNLRDLVVAGGALFGMTDDALWQSDGSVAGTKKGELGGLAPARNTRPVPVDDRVALAVYLPQADLAIGLTDGSAARTEVAVSGRSFSCFGAAGGKLFAIVGDDQNEIPHRLISTHGAPEALSTVFDFFASQGDRIGDCEMATAGNLLFISLNLYTSHSNELWVSDGSAAGTRRVATGIAFRSTGALLPKIVQWNGRLVFTDAWGGGLWISDGTEGGTHEVVEHGLRIPIEGIAALGDRLFIAAESGGYTYDILELDGSDPTTVLIEKLRAPFLSPTFFLIAAGNRIFFPKHDPATGDELWAIQPE